MAKILKERKCPSCGGKRWKNAVGRWDAVGRWGKVMLNPVENLKFWGRTISATAKGSKSGPAVQCQECGQVCHICPGCLRWNRVPRAPQLNELTTCTSCSTEYNDASIEHSRDDWIEPDHWWRE